MTRIAIVGGHGQIAQHLIERLVEQGHTPLALIRDPGQAAALEALGAEIGLLDIESAPQQDFGAAFQGCDAVVFAAGGGPDGNIGRKKTVDLGGSLKSIASARAAGISRFVQISAISVDKPVAADASDVWKAYVEAKRDADIALRDSGLDWTIIRPGTLTDDDATGLVEIAETVERGQIPRADVAHLLAAVLGDDRTIGRQWEVVGGDELIADAVNAAL